MAFLVVDRTLTGTYWWSSCQQLLYVIIVIYATTVIPACDTADCDTAYTDVRLCLTDTASQLTCSDGQFILVQQATVIWTSVDQCPAESEKPGQCANTEDVSDVIRQTCDYTVRQCVLPSTGNIGDDTDATQAGCNGVKLLFVQYLCLEEYSPNATGFLEADTCEDETWRTGDVIQLTSEEGVQCPCTMSLPNKHTLIYLHKKSGVPDTCLSDVTLLLSGAVQTPSGSHTQGTLYDFGLCDNVASSELSISLGQEECALGLYVVVSGGVSPDLTCDSRATTGSPDKEDEDDDNQETVLIAAVVGGVVIVVLIIVVIVVIWVKRSNSESAGQGTTTGAGAVDNPAVQIADDTPGPVRTHPWSRIDEDDRVYQINLDLSTSSQSTEDMVVITDPNALYAKPD